MDIIIKNIKKNQTLNLSGNQNKYQVLNISGIDSADRNIFIDKTTLHYGGIYSGWTINDREFDIKVKINGNRETNRQDLISFLRQDECYRFYFYLKNNSYYIDGYVSNLNYEIFTNSQSVTMTINSPYPYFNRIYKPADPTSQTNNTLLYLYNYLSQNNPDFPAGFAFPDNIDPAAAAGIYYTMAAPAAYTFTPTGRGGVVLMFYNSLWEGVITIKNILNDSQIRIDCEKLYNKFVYIDTRPTFKSVYVLDNYQTIKKNDVIVSGTNWIKTEPEQLNTIQFITPIGTIRNNSYILGYNNEVEGL